MDYDKLAKEFDGQVDYDVAAEEAASPLPPRNEYKPPTINHPTGPSPGSFFPGRQATYHENQARDVEAKTNLVIAQDSAAAKMEMAARLTDNALRMQPTRIEEANQYASASHDAAMTAHHLNLTQSKAQEHIIGKALARDMDAVTFGQVRLSEEKERIRLNGRNQEFRQDLAKARITAKQDVKKAADMARITIEMIVKERMFGKEEVLALQKKLFEQIDSIEALMKLPASEGREFKLKLARTVVTSWMDELNGILQQTAKGDVPRPDGQEPRGLGAAPEPRADTTEDD